MIKYILKIIRALVKKEPADESAGSSVSPKPLSTNLKENIKTIKEIFNMSSDVIVREFVVGKEINAALIFIDGMSDVNIINQHILQPLQNFTWDSIVGELTGRNLQLIREYIVSISDIRETSSLDDLINGSLSGDTALILHGTNKCLVLSSKGFESRGVEQPETEVVVRGPREGNTEKLRTNTTLLRRKIKNPNLVFESITVGETTKTTVSLAYIKGIANDKLVKEVKSRIKKIKTDSVLESGYIEQYIEDAPFSPFPTVGNSEKPDKVSAKILEGRVAILVDGTPIALTVPMVFIESFQVAEDYYSRPYFASIIRMIRYISFIITILAPAAYVALVTHHQEVIPTDLIISMASAREGTPLPAVAETLIMGMVYEILREAGVRLPKAVGSAISIVGALVIGEAAVMAGLIGAPLVIVVAITAIASFVVTPLADVTAILRIVLVIFAGFIGMFGIIIVLLAVLVHLCALRSFGTPYLSPLAPLSPGDLKDTFVRAPIWSMNSRPRTIAWKKPQRQNSGH